jgi:N-acetylglucosaminyldiphosphoundecaprenol N-acetyl-beta-D-mannosaminyltransferase
MKRRAPDYPVPPVELMDIPVHPAGSSQILDYMRGVIVQQRQAVILHINVYGANLAARHPWLKKFFSEAQLVFCDGDGIRWGLRILGLRPPPKVTYNVWADQLAAWCAEHDFSLYLLGARPGVAQRAAINLKARHPALRIAGTHHGYFQKDGPETDSVINEINDASPDVVLVCMGMPVQERWIRANSSRLAAHVLLSAGAALDYVAGIIPVTPAWIARLQMEWVYRFLREPIRLFMRYIVGNPRFVARVVAERLRREILELRIWQQKF